MKSGPLHFILLSLLLSVFVRSLVPVGFMPDTNKMALVICSGMTTKTIMVEDKSSPLGHHPEQKHETCPFAPPVLAGNTNFPDFADYIKISYAPFLPDPTAHLNYSQIAARNIYAQGPPDNFVA